MCYVAIRVVRMLPVQTHHMVLSMTKISTQKVLPRVYKSFNRLCGVHLHDNKNG